MARAGTHWSLIKRIKTDMNNLLSILSKEEYISLTLRELYSGLGYQKYRMSKFEEYDLYVKNKDFLVSENVITFTDTNGKLLALKPDVTLSIVKNSKDVDGVMKVYYDEKVYRVSKGTKSFKEISQSGLECIGKIDEEVISEVLYLAGKSLDLISKDNVLVVSNLNVISGVLDYLKVGSESKAKIIKLLGDKNLFAIKDLLKEENIKGDNCDLITSLVTVYGEAQKTLPTLDRFIVDKSTEKAVNDLKNAVNSAILKGLLSDKIIIDFSVVNDMKYYNGIAFKGFVEGIPTGILSGGQYDNLMKKMNKRYGAIGFAVYLDEVSRLKGE